MYLNKRLIEESFFRLAPQRQGGKTALERTSALMYFLSFDATVKKLSKSPIDLNPETANGKNNRSAMELEFVRLVKLHNASDGTTRQVSVLGEIDENDIIPEKRISSNFFTVPLKRASQLSSEYFYPHRPSPILKMGEFSTSLSWGIDYYDDWKRNLPKLLSDTKSRTPFIDLAIFVLRCTELQNDSTEFWLILFKFIGERFSKQLADFWRNHISLEKVFWRKPGELFQSAYSKELLSSNDSKTKRNNSKNSLFKLDKNILIERVIYLEKLLKENGVEYNKIRGRK